MTETTKANIDNMSYEDLLSLWRHSPSGHPYFQGDIGDDYSQVMAEKKKAIDSGELVRISKDVGW